MARKRGAQAHGASIERHSLVFDRKLNAFRSGSASLPPPPAADSDTALPRKLRNAMALKAGRNLLREAQEQQQSRQRQQQQSKQQQQQQQQRTQQQPNAAGGPNPRGAPPAVGVAAGDKRKTAYLGAKARRKRARREKAAAEAAEEPAAVSAPRFNEVAEAPPAMALERKHALGVLFTKQMTHAAKSTVRTTAAERDSVIAAYRKLRGREALPFLATQARSLI
jgi:hypothetical protein